jgi:calcineurin-like phosphoesterase
MRPEKVLERFLYNTPRPFEPAKKGIRLSGALIDADEETGRAIAIQRVRVDGP